MSHRLDSKIWFFLAAALLLCAANCGAPAVESPKDLPKDLLGVRIGMSKDEAQKSLEQVAVFTREERKRQQLWKLKQDPHFVDLAIGYDENERFRYITAFTEKKSGKKPMLFSSVGDLTKAKAEIVVPHHRYIWEIPAEGRSGLLGKRLWRQPGDNHNLLAGENARTFCYAF